ncbi:MAG: SDR family NAD(P)-dependent oxidoreductase [Anaerolineales bacterium]
MNGNKVVLITGASSGIGEATARIAAQKNYRIFVTARRAERLERLCSEINTNGGEASFYPADLTDSSQIPTLVEEVMKRYASVDVLINNAGFGRLRWLEQLDPIEDIAKQIQLNLIAAMQLTRYVLPIMIQNHQGHIININSLAGLIATPTYSVYAASKFGLRGFSEALRREVKVYHIKVSGVYPGGVDTEFVQHAGIERKTSVQTPAWMRLNAMQVAKAIVDLIRRPKRQLIMPGYMSYLVWINQIFPGFVDRLLEIGFVNRERKQT